MEIAKEESKKPASAPQSDDGFLPFMCMEEERGKEEESKEKKDNEPVDLEARILALKENNNNSNTNSITNIQQFVQSSYQNQINLLCQTSNSPINPLALGLYHNNFYLFLLLL